MPYIITTITEPEGVMYAATSRRAVGTLNEARDTTNTAAERARATDAVFAEIEALPVSGGTVGPLPDGTVIEVEPTEWGELVHAGRLDRDADDERLIIDAYNAAQED